jgi:integrase
LERRRADISTDVPRVFPDFNSGAADYRGPTEITSGAYEWKDLRRTLSTRLAALGFGEEVVGRVLNHAKHTVTTRHYIKHSYLSETRRALEGWDRELARILADDEAAATNLVPFRR